jgi:DNA-binding transcriptional MerR regulator
MRTETANTVGTIAGLVGVTVRTLHHYDEIGLVVPSQRSESGYRLYARADVARLQEVLFFKELGFGLDEIKQAIDAPGYRREAVLRRQRDLLAGKQRQLAVMVEAIDKAIEADRMGINMATEEMLEAFGGFDPTEYQTEVEDRWGGTDPYVESQRRVANYTRDDWRRVRDEAAAINEGLLDLMAGGVPADTTAAMDLAEAHRAHLSKWFYDCSPEMHAGLGQMYITDPRFEENIDKAGTGLAKYLAAAIAANAARS